jgi:hypothetical protein
VWVELAGSHVLDHALTQRTDSGSVAHGSSILSEVDKTSISGGRLSHAPVMPPIMQFRGSFSDTHGELTFGKATNVQ